MTSLAQRGTHATGGFCVIAMLRVVRRRLEEWQRAGCHWVDRMQLEMAVWGKLASKLSTTRSAREAFDDPWSFGLAGNVASISSIDVQREALSLSAPTKCRAARRIALKKTG